MNTPPNSPASTMIKLTKHTNPIWTPAFTPTLIPVLIIAAHASCALAQNESAQDTPGNQAQVEAAQAILPRVGTNQTPVMPTQNPVSVAVQPGLTDGQDWLKVLHETLDEPTEPSTLAEGAFVLGRPGQLFPGPNGLWIFVPDKETRHPGEGPVLLMPCHTLERLEAQWSGQPIEVSGEIFTYHNRNQLLISAYRIGVVPSTNTNNNTEQPVNQSDTPADSQLQNQVDNQPDNQPASLEDDPDVRDLLNELEFQNQPSNASEHSIHQDLNQDPSFDDDLPPARPQVEISSNPGMFEEGTLILRKPSRMIRNPDGAWAIVFDNDNPDAAQSPELIIQPCKMLMRIEPSVMEAGDSARLLVSGRIYTYKGAYYILPTLMQRIRPQEINSLQ